MVEGHSALTTVGDVLQYCSTRTTSTCTVLVVQTRYLTVQVDLYRYPGLVEHYTRFHVLLYIIHNFILYLLHVHTILPVRVFLFCTSYLYIATCVHVHKFLFFYFFVLLHTTLFFVSAVHVPVHTF